VKVLYLKGSRSEIDAAISQQLLTVAPDLAITPVATAAEALVEIRKTPAWQALLISPSLSQNDTLALIAGLRRDRVPIAIVPVVEDTQQERYAAAVSSGADDVLMRRGQSLVNVAETIERIRQSHHAFPAEPRRRLRVLYAGRDPLVWGLIEQVPFVKAERITCGADGSCPVRVPGADDGSLRCDAVIIDEQPDDAHPLLVLKSVKTQASDLPVIVLTSNGGAEIATAALELGADDTVLKTGIFRRRLIATLRRVYQRLELQFQQAEIKAREERLRLIVERVPAAIAVIAGDGAVLAMNAEALHLVGAAKPREVVGRDFRTLVAPEDHETVTDLLRRVGRGEVGSVNFHAETLAGERVPLHLRGAVLERDAKGTRGVIASLSPLPISVATDGAPAPPPAETAQMALAIADLERAGEDLRSARVRDAAERHVLEQQLEDAREGLRERTELQRRLDQSADDLRQAEATLAAERQEWQATQLVVTMTAEQLEASHLRIAGLEAAAAGLRDELRQLLEEQARERQEWLDARAALETHLGDAEASLMASREHAAEAQGRLEAERHEVQQALDAARRDLSAARETLEAERGEWQRTREHLEGEARARIERESGDTAGLRELHQRLEEALHALQAEHADLVETLAAERAQRERDARELDALRATIDQHDRARAELEARARDAERQAGFQTADLQERQRVLESRLSDTGRRLDEAGHEIARLHVALDDERARSVEEQHRLMTSSLVGYALTTRDGRIRRCNDTFARLFGYSDASDLMHRIGAQPFVPLGLQADDVARLTAAGRLERAGTCLERPDGRAIRVHESATVLPENRDGESLIERMVVEVDAASPLEVLQARRLEEVGSLATAMAPDIERLSADVERRVRDLRHRFGQDAAAAGELAACARAAAQSAALVRQLAAFGRRQGGTVATVNLNDTIRQAEPMLAQLVGEYIGFDIRLGPPATLAANTPDLDQLLTSLVTFGRDALPAGGSLLLETSAVAQEEALAPDLGSATRVSLTASGYGVQHPVDAPALALVARRAGAELRITGEPGWQLQLHAVFPRCAKR
jgi:PAS domain S-box-containing protein